MAWPGQGGFVSSMIAKARNLRNHDTYNLTQTKDLQYALGQRKEAWPGPI